MKKTFKNTRVNNIWGGSARFEGWAISEPKGFAYDRFPVNEWDMEVTFTRKIAVGSRVMHKKYGELAVVRFVDHDDVVVLLDGHTRLTIWWLENVEVVE